MYSGKALANVAQGVGGEHGEHSYAAETRKPTNSRPTFLDLWLKGGMFFWLVFFLWQKNRN